MVVSLHDALTLACPYDMPGKLADWFGLKLGV
jgi:hypothetical protein